MSWQRRKFLQTAALAASAAPLAPLLATAAPKFRISLAQWSLHRTYFGDSFGPGFFDAFRADPGSVLQGDRDPLDFPLLAREEFGISAVEYVNTFYFARARNENYLNALASRANDAGVRSLLIMCDALGNTGDQDQTVRRQAVENHRPWLTAAALLGCHAIRVNAAGQGPAEELSKRVAESLNDLAELAAPYDLGILVENHGGLSSDGTWLAATIARADHPRVGSLPDFGNFRISGSGDEAVFYDRYQGVAELMPFAHAVSAKSYDFDAQGFETSIDYQRMLRLVLEAGYNGHVGIEYEGTRLSEFDGIRATRNLLRRYQ